MTQVGASTGAMTPMPQYQSHKKVWALKIHMIESCPNGGALITPSEDGYAPFEVTPEWVAKHDPKAGGYYVQYEGGYSSWSPAEAFESGYTALPHGRQSGKPDGIELLAHTFSYHSPTQDQLPKYDAIRKTSRVLAMVILETCPPCADRSAAIRKLREAAMTANASIALGGKSV